MIGVEREKPNEQEIVCLLTEMKIERESEKGRERESDPHPNRQKGKDRWV